MKQNLLHVALLVKDYDEAIEYFTKVLNFVLIEDTYQAEQQKRWVIIRPPGSNNSTSILLAKASKLEQEEYIGRQTGGRVFLFLQTDNFWRDYNQMKERGVVFSRDPTEHDYGIVAVFEDLYGNLWDLIELTNKE